MWNLFLLCLMGYGIWAAVRSGPRDSKPVVPSRERLEGWKRVVEWCGLQVQESTAALSPQLTARGEQVEVRIEAFGTEGDTRIVVKAPMAPDFARVRIRPQSPPARGVQVGDPGFYFTLAVEGPAPQVFALLDADTRRRLRGVNAAGRLEISPRQILAIVSGSRSVSDVLPSLLAIRERLGAPAVFRPPSRAWRCSAVAEPPP